MNPSSTSSLFSPLSLNQITASSKKDILDQEQIIQEQSKQTTQRLLTRRNVSSLYFQKDCDIEQEEGESEEEEDTDSESSFDLHHDIWESSNLDLVFRGINIDSWVDRKDNTFNIFRLLKSRSGQFKTQKENLSNQQVISQVERLFSTIMGHRTKRNKWNDFQQYQDANPFCDNFDYTKSGMNSVLFQRFRDYFLKYKQIEKKRRTFKSSLQFEGRKVRGNLKKKLTIEIFGPLLQKPNEGVVPSQQITQRGDQVQKFQNQEQGQSQNRNNLGIVQADTIIEERAQTEISLPLSTESNSHRLNYKKFISINPLNLKRSIHLKPSPLAKDISQHSSQNGSTANSPRKQSIEIYNARPKVTPNISLPQLSERGNSPTKSGRKGKIVQKSQDKFEKPSQNHREMSYLDGIPSSFFDERLLNTINQKKQQSQPKDLKSIFNDSKYFVDSPKEEKSRFPQPANLNLINNLKEPLPSLSFKDFIQSKLDQSDSPNKNSSPISFLKRINNQPKNCGDSMIKLQKQKIENDQLTFQTKSNEIMQNNYCSQSPSPTQSNHTHLKAKLRSIVSGNENYLLKEQIQEDYNTPKHKIYHNPNSTNLSLNKSNTSKIEINNLGGNSLRNRLFMQQNGQTVKQNSNNKMNQSSSFKIDKSIENVPQQPKSRFNLFDLNSKKQSINLNLCQQNKMESYLRQ